MERMISSSLRKDISLKFEKVQENSLSLQKRENLYCQEARALGDIYSFWIENPKLRRALLIEKKIPKTLKKMARKGIQDIHNAWYFLSQKDSGEFPFIDILDKNILKKVNKLVEPNFWGSGDFRKKDVTLNIPGYTPVSWEKISEEVDSVFSLAKQKYLEDPLECAIYLHLALASTQPFMEGNKRTAPAIIPAGEGTFYHNLFIETFKAYKDKNSLNQVPFYDYCASKVNNSLDCILGDLDIK
jgi:hypothetical protein